MKLLVRLCTLLAVSLIAGAAFAAEPPLKLGVGVFPRPPQEKQPPHLPPAQKPDAKHKQPAGSHRQLH